MGGSSSSYSANVELVNLSGTNNSLCGEPIPNLPHYANYISSTITANGTLIECGGATTGASYSQLCYYLGVDNEWHLAPVLPSGRSQGSMVTIDNYVVYLGGRGGSASDDIYKIEDTLTGSWSHPDNMIYARFLHCSVVIDTGVIIIG